MSGINIYLKLKLKANGELKGPSNHKGHKEEMLVESFTWGQSNQNPVGGKSRALQVRDFQVVKSMCRASPLLVLAAATNDTVQEAVVSVRNSDSQENIDFVTWTLLDGMVSSYEVEASTANLAPKERITIRFRTLKVEYRPLDSGGFKAAVEAQIDVASVTGSR